MSLTAAGFLVFFLSMPVIQGQGNQGVTYTPTEICAFRGSTVDISCSYTYPPRIDSVTTVKKTLWFTKVRESEAVDLMTDPVYAGRVQHRCDENICTLRITDLRPSDSTRYNFMFITNQPDGTFFGVPGVSLTVTDRCYGRSSDSGGSFICQIIDFFKLHVQVIGSIVYQGYTKAELQCRSSSCGLPDGPSYIWYKSGQKIETQTSSHLTSSDTTDSFSCALRGREDFPSPSVCVGGLNCNSVIYTDRSICAFKGSSVDISCMYNGYRSITSKFWFRSERSRLWQNPSHPEDLKEDSQYGGRVQVLETERGRSTLRITDLRETDSAQYHFRFKTGSFEWRSSLPGTTLTVTDPDLQVLVMRYSSSSSWAKLRCHSICRLPDHVSYIWYKNGEKIWREKVSYSDYFGPADSYSCAVKGLQDFPSPSQCVRGQICNRLTYTDRSICAFKGSSVDISCMYNGYQFITSKFWFSSERSRLWQNPLHPEDLKEDSQYEGRVQVLETERGRSTLRITDLRETDSAQYHFRFKTGSFEWRSSLPGTTLTVTALQVQVIRLTVHQSYTYAELKCDSSCSPVSYIWFKNGVRLMKEESSSYVDRFYPGDKLSCALKGHEDYGSAPVYALKVPSVSVSPSAEVEEGSSVTLTCSSDANPAASYTWYKENLNLKPLSEKPQLFFSSIQSSDSGQYNCTAENELGKRTSEYISIDVKYAPKLPSVSVSPSAEVEEGSSVTLTCSSDANPAASYTWYKENQTLSQGPEGSYYFGSISSEDRGVYYCKSENQYGKISSTSLFIDVQYAPKLPSVSVSPSAEVEEGSSVNLTCSSDANPAASYTWYKENEDTPKASGQIFTITDFRPEHSGSYYCEAQNRRGRLNSTLCLIDVAGACKSTAVRTTTAVVLAAILLFVFLMTRKKRAAEQSSEPGARSCFRKQYRPTQTQLDDQQDDLNYARVQFSNHRTDSLYANITPAQTLRHTKEESVVYAAVQLKRGRTSPSQKSEDSATLYSTINKTS